MRKTRPFVNYSKNRDLAYASYTSGTTGKLKEVLIINQSVTNLITYLNKRYLKLLSHLQVALVSNYNFDFPVWQMFNALLYGHTPSCNTKRLNIRPNRIQNSYQYTKNKYSLFVYMLFCIVTLCSTVSQAQFKGKIIEKESKSPVPFASVAYQKQSFQKVVISDVYGVFEIKEVDIDSIMVSCVGYKKNKVAISVKSNTKAVVIELEPVDEHLNEIIILSSDNPALRIIKNVLNHKKENNFSNYDKYAYQCYFKTLLDVKRSNDTITLDSIKATKSERSRKRTYAVDKRFKKQGGFISECVISSLKVNDRTENKIIAQRTSGFDDPLLVQTFVATFHHAISFYNNSISLFETPITNDKSIAEYVSPLADGCLNYYNFQLEDNYVNNTDSIFAIDFYPKKGKNFNGLKGKLFISSNGYAIKSIVVEPFEKGLIGFKFCQDYEYTNNRWFPSKLDEEVSWTSLKIKGLVNASPVYLITTKLDSINYEPNISKGEVNLEKVYMDEISIKKSDSIINAKRADSLTLREKETFHFVDSVGRKRHFNYLTKLLPKLMVAKIPIGYLDIDLNELARYNNYEESRLGIGLSTSEKLSKYLMIGGFIGYGLKDKNYKYGGRTVFYLDKYNEVELEVSYQNNLKEIGVNQINDHSIIGYKFDNCIEQKAEFSFRAFRYFKLAAAVNSRQLKPTYSYSFKGTNLINYYADEIRISLKYAHGQSLARFGNQRIVSFEGNPIINLTYYKGMAILNKNCVQYNKVEATLDLTAYNGRTGQSDFRLEAGLVDQGIPCGLLFTGEGSKDPAIALLIKNHFQTMYPYEFLSDKYINLFYSHNFGSLLFTTKKFKPQFVIVQNSGWGTLSNSSFHEIDFKKKDKIFLESGLKINNILRLNFVNMFYLGFGVGGFYRYGYYSFPNFKDNLAFKIAISISFK